MHVNDAARRRSSAPARPGQTDLLPGLGPHAPREGYVQGKMDALTAKLDVAMKELQSNMPNYQNADHIEQVTGIKWKDGVDKYWDRKVYTADSEFAHVTGRHYYKVLFNLKKPGYWTYM